VLVEPKDAKRKLTWENAKTNGKSEEVAKRRNGGSRVRGLSSYASTSMMIRRSALNWVNLRVKVGGGRETIAVRLWGGFGVLQTRGVNSRRSEKSSTKAERTSAH